ncbi:hypothetical protein KC19_4G090700 [Ceratodon purpureus]|uniref:Uncharacterized protein n=1 Tax=Ceratodon purpureus TaxID=3225 RepID=A0A8T0I8L4_CERPU|nr:hypothetical protein KC19_4G090700 [Ceratodon purpureus]
MTSNATAHMWIMLFVVGMAVMELAAAVRELSGSPTASLDATTVTDQDMMIEWLRITAVPLGVFLMGACTWGCIKNSVVWRSLTCERREVSIAPEALEMQPTELPSNSSRDGSDLEEGIAVSHCRMDDGSAGSAQTFETMQQLARTPITQTDDGNRAAADVAPR